jgi:hypothetical protein
MPTAHLTLVKNKKASMASFLETRFYNHPHRLPSVALSGALTYTVDERSFTAHSSPVNGEVAYVFVFNLTFTGTAAYTRIFESRYPWISVPSGTPAQGEFLISHRHGTYFWRFEIDSGPTLDPEVIGTVTRSKYVYSSGAWGLDSVDAPQDITLQFTFSISGGGDPTSGGRDDDSDDERATILVTPDLSGTYSDKLPEFGSTNVYRFPWDDPWASETTAFSDIFATHLITKNAADGGGHSGTCSMSLDFT